MHIARGMTLVLLMPITEGARAVSLTYCPDYIDYVRGIKAGQPRTYARISHIIGELESGRQAAWL